MVTIGRTDSGMAKKQRSNSPATISCDLAGSTLPNMHPEKMAKARLSDLAVRLINSFFIMLAKIIGHTKSTK